MRRRLITLFITAMLIAVLPACSTDRSAADQGAADEPLTGWDYFESFNPIGDTYSNIESSHKSLDEEGNYDGGIILKVDGNDKLYFGFPKYSKSLIEPDDQCTSVYGDMETVFGIDYYISLSELVEKLDITINQDYENTYYAMKVLDSGTYMMRIELDNIDEKVSPETPIAIFQSDEMAGSASEGQ